MATHDEVFPKKPPATPDFPSPTPGPQSVGLIDESQVQAYTPPGSVPWTPPQDPEGGTRMAQALPAAEAAIAQAAIPQEPITGPFPGALPQLVEGPASQIYNMNLNQQFGQQNQDQLTQMLTQAALGLGPSQAQSMMQMQNDRMLQQMQTQGTLGGALGVSQAQMAAPMQNAQALGQMGRISAQEQQAGMAGLGENIFRTRQQDLAQADAAARWIQSSNEFNNMVTEQMAKGWQDASGAAVDQTKIALMIQNAIQQRGQFLTNAEIRVIFAEAGMTPTAGETSTFSDIGAPAFEGATTVGSAIV